MRPVRQKEAWLDGSEPPVPVNRGPVAGWGKSYAPHGPTPNLGATGIGALVIAVIRDVPGDNRGRRFFKNRWSLAVIIAESAFAALHLTSAQTPQNFQHE